MLDTYLLWVTARTVWKYPTDYVSSKNRGGVNVEYEFKKKSVEESAMNVDLYAESKNEGDCVNQGICGDIDGVCGT